jgi:hypothetical protein
MRRRTFREAALGSAATLVSPTVRAVAEAARPSPGSTALMVDGHPRMATLLARAAITDQIALAIIAPGQVTRFLGR